MIRGDLVERTTGDYQGRWLVLSLFTKINGKGLAVAESLELPGLVHVFGPDNLKTVEETESERLARLVQTFAPLPWADLRQMWDGPHAELRDLVQSRADRNMLAITTGGLVP